jgi:drug/metabolite transporter (DMT)-like permease
VKAKGPILLLITALLWGMAFVAQTEAAQSVDPFTFNFSRNFIGALFLTGVIAFRKRAGQDIAPGIKPERPDGTQSEGYTRRALIIGGTLCGIALCVASYLQQAGITAYPPEAAASGRAGFVTATYMVMVAVMMIFVGKRPHFLVWTSVLVAIVGMYFLCVPDGLGSVYVGDWLVLASALGYAIHIIVIDRYTRIDGVRLSRVQLIVAGVISLVFALIFEHPSMSMVLAAAIPILYAGICSDGIAYTFQIIAQKTTDATVASIIMSLESVFAALGGWLILSESLSPVELGGCALVFAAVMLAQAPEFIEARRTRQKAIE